MASRIVSTFSLFCCLCATVFATDFVRLQHDFDSAGDNSSRAQVLGRFLKQNHGLSEDDPQLFQAVGRCEDLRFSPSAIKDLKDSIDLRVRIQTGTSGSRDQVATRDIKDIKSSPLYLDSNRTYSNWLQKALAHLSAPQPRLPNFEAPAPMGLFGTIFLYGAIVILAAATIFLIYLFARQFQYKKRLRRRARALLEEEEPERTADEWLRLTDGLTAQGRYREAVRCLYLACLLRFDEANVARFDRGETNWEHLGRIHASARRPPEIDFRPATQAFDQIWYGHRIRGIDDVEKFRTWYNEVVDGLRRVAG